ncbi:hypothetical protein [Actinoalloteichus hymeniacidonis]|uniref:Uncharacterized protein n=1 Tax=Actinoalloteichus hymeniacidonis TaxID=340345 RepID=A0AAC9HU66_9PSEU|nr:hypothetical protein [Actinoalloteichus hymeniacidonis]AOS65394.1 hypothetical protein TL08_23070 [Actinoalloteichus hymeniacidonis]MBB5906520.1 hypothetical protein [Actinoalloteichus hymeniacidonis]
MGGAGEVRAEILDIAGMLPIQRLIRQQENSSAIVAELVESWRGSEYPDAPQAVADLRHVGADLTAAIGALGRGAELLRDYSARL